MNLIKFKNKKLIIFSIIILVLFIIVFYYWWEDTRKITPPEKWETAKISEKGDYKIIKENIDGKVIENEKMGLSYIIPKYWISKKEDLTTFYSPDANFKENSSVLLERGCKINIYSSYIKTDIESLKNYNDREIKMSPLIELDEFLEIRVSNYPALKYSFHTNKLEMSYVGVSIPVKNKLYNIKLSSSIKEIERCKEEFNNFLQTISIK